MVSKLYDFYVGPDTSLEGASLVVIGTAKVDGLVRGKIIAEHLIVGRGATVGGEVQSETALVYGLLEDSIAIKAKLTVRSSGRIRGSVSYGSLETQDGAKLVGRVSTGSD